MPATPPAIAAKVAFRKANGLCIDCGQPAPPKAGKGYHVRCLRCKEKLAERRALKIAKGVCTMCRSRARRGKTTCSDCSKIASARCKKYQKRLTQRG